MTAPNIVRHAARSWLMPATLGVFAVGIAINFALLLPALHRQSIQAAEGQKARARQRVIYPMVLKMVKDARHRKVITADDLCRFRTGRRCRHP